MDEEAVWGTPRSLTLCVARRKVGHFLTENRKESSLEAGWTRRTGEEGVGTRLGDRNSVVSLNIC